MSVKENCSVLVGTYRNKCTCEYGCIEAKIGLVDQARFVVLDVGWIDSQDSARLRALQRKRSVEICQPLKLSISEQFPHFWGDQDADANFNGSRIALVTPTSGRIGVSTILSRPAAISPTSWGKLTAQDWAFHTTEEKDCWKFSRTICLVSGRKPLKFMHLLHLCVWEWYLISGSAYYAHPNFRSQLNRHPNFWV